MGKCRVCNEREAASDRDRKCLHCRRLYHKRWRAKNKKKCREYAKRRYAKAKKRGIIDNSQYSSQRVPNYLRGQVEVCRAMRAAVLSSKPCEECGKMASEVHEREEGVNRRLCRECHLKYH